MVGDCGFDSIAMHAWRIIGWYQYPAIA